MRLTVVWDPDASDRLAEIWLTASDKHEIRDAADEIDSTLREDAHLEGFPFAGRRILGVTPLVVVFTVSLPDRMVRINEVWRAGEN